MAHISVEEVHTLWNDLENKSWQGLKKSLRNNVDLQPMTQSGINSRTIDILISMADHLEYVNQPFPQDEKSLYDAINANFGFQHDLQKRV